jgi:hypothetical protein
MYSRQEISKQKQAFWTAFGRYMQPILSAEELPVSWINYKTGVPGISFKMDADHQQVVISILMSSSDISKQQAFYNRLAQMRHMLEETLGETDWQWQSAVPDEYGKTVSSVSKRLKGVSIHRQEDWAAIISFLKPRIIALDAFWSMGKYGFEELM